MKYMGSKRRIAKQILPIILQNRKEGQYYVEPFCGGCNMIDKVEGNRIANDANQYIVSMWDAMVNDGWIPPSKVTEDEYNAIKNNKDHYPQYLVGFVGVALTFGSKWFRGYARNKRGTNYAMEGRDNLYKQIARLKGTEFQSVSYDEMVIPDDSIIYCDPPYQSVTGYKDKFDSEKFWQWCREMTVKGHTVYISEYQAPSDFICVWQQELNSNMDASVMKKSVEKLFTYKV